MVISMEEEHKTLEYQEKMKVDVGNIAKNIIFKDQYMKLLILHFLQQRNVFRQNVLTNVIKIQMNLSSYRLESNELFLNGYVTRVICTSFIHRKEPDNKKEKENT